MIWLLLVIGIFVGDGLCKTYMDRSLQEKEQRPVVSGHENLRKFHTLAGGVSNLYYRMKRVYVVDYFSFRVPLEKLRRIVFNLSDLFIFAGAGLMIVYSFFKRK